MRFVDEDGKMTGIRGRIIDIDSVKDEKLYLKVKSRAELDHVEALPKQKRWRNFSKER
jgi:hypothetical protein